MTVRIEQMPTIWRNVIQGVGQHGDFLRYFANAYTRADENNKVILYSASLALITQYKLNTHEYTTEKL